MNKLKSFSLKNLFSKKQNVSADVDPEKQAMEKRSTLERLAKLNMLDGWLCSEYYQDILNRSNYKRDIYTSQKNVLKSIADQQIKFNHDIIDSSNLRIMQPLEDRIADFSNNSHFIKITNAFLEKKGGIWQFNDFPAEGNIPFERRVCPICSLDEKYDFKPLVEKLKANRFNRSVTNKIEKFLPNKFEQFYIRDIDEHPLHDLRSDILFNLSDKYYNDYHLSQQLQKNNNNINEK